MSQSDNQNTSTPENSEAQTQSVIYEVFGDRAGYWLKYDKMADAYDKDWLYGNV